MDKYQAQEIISQYGKAIAGRAGIAGRKSSLPCSKARIRQAFFELITTTIKEKKGLPKEIGDNLVTTYSMLDIFTDDKEADEINEIENFVKKEGAEKVLNMDKVKFDKYMNFSFNLCSTKDMEEINDYIRECYK